MVAGNLANCITVPAFSFGYIKIPILPVYIPHREAGLSNCIPVIFPNPSADYFAVGIKEITNENRNRRSIKTISVQHDTRN